jgi:membrane-bound metal-dependent hydrolase YbcI (DUF457 family)
MVKLMGHLGLALLWAAPAWIVWDNRVSLAFIGFTLVTSMLPDTDLVLQAFLPVHHHGVTHTIVFVATVSLIAGALVEFGLKDRLERELLERKGYRTAPGGLFLFAAGGMFLGGMSHIFGDTLSAPDIAQPIEPYWPFFDKPYTIDVIWYSSPWWNVGLLAVAIALHAVLAYLDFGGDIQFGICQES